MKGSASIGRKEATDAALMDGAAQFSFRSERGLLIARDLGNAIIGLLVVILLWWGVAELMMFLRGVAFPTPPETLIALWEALMGADINGESIFAHTSASLGRWGQGYFIAMIIGLTLGMAFGTLPRLYDVGMIPVYVFQMIPGLAWIPIAMLIFGLGETATVFIIAMTAIPPLVINTAGGIREVPTVFTRVARMSGKDDSAMFFRVLLPAASLSIINGMRIGLANGWRVLIAAEMIVGVALGLGFSIYMSRYDLDFTSAFVCIVVICIIGLAIEKLLFVSMENRVRHRLGLDREDLM